MRRSATAWLALMLLGVTGCRHKTTVVVPPKAQAPVALEPVPVVNLPPTVASVPPQSPPVATVELPKKKVHKQHHRPVTEVPPQPAPVQVATAAPPPPIAAVIGSLSAGGDTSVERKQEALNLITDNEKRLKALSRETVERQRDSVMRVSNFDRDAMEALKGGDAEGALTLAKKAQVLLDDLEK